MGVPPGDVAFPPARHPWSRSGHTDIGAVQVVEESEPLSHRNHRVKVLVLTPEGEQLHESLVERLMTDSPLTRGLPARDQVELLRLLHLLEPPD